MTGREAAQILENPIFGNQVCIDAVKVLQMAEDLLLARQWAKRKELCAPGMSDDAIPPVAAMEHESIEDELAYWRHCGWRCSQ
jgi:hypothetical protein